MNACMSYLGWWWLKQVPGLCIWTCLAFPLVLTMGWLWPLAWLITQERPSLSYWHTIQWAWLGFIPR